MKTRISTLIIFLLSFVFIVSIWGDKERKEYEMKKPVDTVVLGKMNLDTSTGKYSSSKLVFVLQEIYGQKRSFDVIVSPTTFVKYGKGDYLTFKLREREIKYDSSKEWKYGLLPFLVWMVFIISGVMLCAITAIQIRNSERKAVKRDFERR